PRWRRPASTSTICSTIGTAGPDVAVVVALAAAYGVFLVYTGVALGWRGVGPGPKLARRTRGRPSLGHWLADLGIDTPPAPFLGVILTLFAFGAAAAYLLFAGPLPAVAAGLFAATF